MISGNHGGDYKCIDDHHRSCRLKPVHVHVTPELFRCYCAIVLCVYGALHSCDVEEPDKAKG